VSDTPPLHALIAQIGLQQRHDPHGEIIRQIVRLRARDACEYCLGPTTGQYQIDHVIPEARWLDYRAGRLSNAMDLAPGRSGPNHIANFAWCCPFCNQGKRQRVVYRIGSQTIRLYDPRRDMWPEHFAFMNNYLFVVGITPIGIVTQRAVRFNDGGLDGPLGTRHDNILAGLYPPHWAAATLL